MPRKKKQTFEQRVRSIQFNEVETKRNIETFNSTAVSTTTSNTHMTDITTGDGSGARDGNDIVLRSFYGKFTAGQHASATASVLRVVLYTPKQNDNLLSSLDYIDRIDQKSQIVWVDKLITLNSNTPVKRFTISYKFYNKMRKGMLTQYSDGTSASIDKHPVYLLMVSNEDTNTVTVNGDATLYYKDP